MADQSDHDDDNTPRNPDIQHRGRDATSPIVRLVEREYDPIDYEIARRLRQSGSGDPALMLAKFLRAMESREQDSGERLEKELGAAIKKQDEELVALRSGVADLKRTASTASWIVRGILAGVSLFAVYVLDRVVTRVERDGEQKVQLQWIEKRIENLETPRRNQALP